MPSDKGNWDDMLSNPNALNNYKFYLAFENGLCENYVTEKCFKALVPGTYTVPIVLGHASYQDLLQRQIPMQERPT